MALTELQRNLRPDVQVARGSERGIFIFYDKNTVKCLGIFPFVIASNGLIC